jgi:hypothetical protein
MGVGEEAPGASGRPVQMSVSLRCDTRLNSDKGRDRRCGRRGRYDEQRPKGFSTRAPRVIRSGGPRASPIQRPAWRGSGFSACRTGATEAQAQRLGRLRFASRSRDPEAAHFDAFAAALGEHGYTVRAHWSRSDTHNKTWRSPGLSSKDESWQRHPGAAPPRADACDLALCPLGSPARAPRRQVWSPSRRLPQGTHAGAQVVPERGRETSDQKPERPGTLNRFSIGVA